MTDIETNSNKRLFEFFQSKIACQSGDTAYKYRKTLIDFETYINSHNLSLKDDCSPIVADWCIRQLGQELSLTTIKQRLNILNSLFSAAAKNSLIGQCDEPRRIARLLDSPDFKVPRLLKTSVLNKTLSLIRKQVCHHTDQSIYVEMLVFSVLNGVRPLEEIIYIKKNKLCDFQGYSRVILERNLDSRRKYAFNLRQSYLTPHQIVTQITDEISKTLGYITAPGRLAFNTLSASLWAALALKSGATPSEAIGGVSQDPQYTLPSFVSVPHKDQAGQDKWQKAIEMFLTHEKPKWYAMRLRRGVAYTEIQEVISQRVHPKPELFYPVETIKKKLGRKTTLVENPIISQTVFFKCYPENVIPMFASIGDKAWCFKVSNQANAPYAVIPDYEMHRFQRAIGVFSADTEIKPLGTLIPRPGETVILIQPGYGNREATIEDILHSKSGTILFRVRLTTDYGYEWRQTVDARQIEPLTP